MPFLLNTDLKLIYSEELYEDEMFPAPQLAALVASKVYYNLGEFDASMKYALVAGDKFDLSKRTEYIETVICTYIYLWYLV